MRGGKGRGSEGRGGGRGRGGEVERRGEEGRDEKREGSGGGNTLPSDKHRPYDGTTQNIHTLAIG